MFAAALSVPTDLAQAMPLDPAVQWQYCVSSWVRELGPSGDPAPTIVAVALASCPDLEQMALTSLVTRNGQMIGYEAMTGLRETVRIQMIQRILKQRASVHH